MHRETGWERLQAALGAGDPDDEVTDTWVANEKVRPVYLTDDVAVAAVRLDDAIAWFTNPASAPSRARS